jgi:hypothetical protein
MIGSLVRSRLRARPVADGVAAYGGYMELLYDPSAPWEVRLAGFGPYASHVAFSRDLLVTALAGEPAGEGAVRVRLCHLPGVRHCLLVVTVAGPDGPAEVALTEATAAAFLARTMAMVPAGEEHRFVDIDAGLARLLGDS